MILSDNRLGAHELFYILNSVKSNSREDFFNTFFKTVLENPSYTFQLVQSFICWHGGEVEGLQSFLHLPFLLLFFFFLLFFLFSLFVFFFLSPLLVLFFPC